MIITLMLLLFINILSFQGYAATAAGTRITNQAEASYFDTGSGQVIRIVSNYATLVVAPLLAVQQDQDQSLAAGPGQMIYFPHTIVNTGNQPDAYLLTVSNQTGDNGDLLNLLIYLDENGDGLVNPGEQPITSTSQLQPNQQIQVVIAGIAPENAQPGDQYTLVLETQSQKDPKIKDQDIDTVTVSDGAIIRLNRITDTDCSIVLSLHDRSYHEVHFTNTGTLPPAEKNIRVDGVLVQGILIQETIPDPFTLLKDPLFFAEPGSAMLVVGTPLGEWLSYAQWDSSTVIDKLGIILPASQLKPNQSGKYGFTYQVSEQGQEVSRPEMQAILDVNGDGQQDYQSNRVCNTIEPEETIIKERPSLVLYGTVFNSASLDGLSGVTVQLISVAAGNTPVATSNTDENGYYEFTDIPKGDYYLEVLPPPGYEDTSQQPPDYFTTYMVSQPSYGQDGFGQTGSGAGILHLDMAAEAQQIDVPLDQEGIRGQIAITKSSSTESASIGEPVAYTITINNLTKQDLYATYIEDLLPPGFKYLKGTAKQNGAYIDDPLINHNHQESGRTQLSFRIGDFHAGAEHTLTYIAQVTALASASDGINTAYAYGDTITNLQVTSPVSSAQVKVIQEGVLSDQAILFGRIAMAPGCKIGDDPELIANGYPLAGVRLYLEDGTYVITDPNGQYSLYGLQPGVHVLKVDGHSLPQGVELTLTNSAQAGDPDSRFVDLLPGDFYRADFTTACPESITRIVEVCPEPPPVTAQEPEQPAPVMVRQCVDKPVEKRHTTLVTRTINNVVKPIHFDSGKADIPPDYITKLHTLIDQTKDKQNVRFRFVGHTDNQRLKPSTKAKFATNQGLSEARAGEVAQYVLKNLNIQTRVSVDGKGETRPVASNATPQGMAKNRRVELVMMYDEPKVTITRSSKKECTMKAAAPAGKVAGKVKNMTAQQKQTPQQMCVSKTITEIHPVISNILARSKTTQLGWENEIESLDPSNTGNLRNLSRLAGKDGDISNGLMEAFRQKTTRHQQEFARDQEQQAMAEEAEQAAIPDPREAVKTITREQGKTGTWLWPLGDTSLDGRFMAVVRSGVTPTLLVNGQAVPNSQLGEQIENRKAKAQILAWYGVALKDGENTLKITAKGPFGNERTLAEKVFKRPSSGVAITMRVDETLKADGGRSMVPVQIEILDSNGYPAKGTYFLTLEASDGMWAEPDIQDKVPGHQVKVTNGSRTVHLRSSANSGQIKLRAGTGQLQSETDVAQVAELRPLVAVGLLDLRVHRGYRKGYENLGLTQLDESEQDTEFSGRAALFMKGRVRNNMHLTFSYDNQKDPDAELLRDIDPAEYYRVYGDSSIRGFEAQSRSRLYAKLEKERHSIMWGDYLTDNGAGGADIARAQRTLTGVNGIYDNGTTRVQLFAAGQSNPRGYEEIQGNGTAMQYQLQDTPIVRNSEVIEIVIRDRTNTGLILDSETLQRFRDYSIDDVTGYITFHRVIPSLDEELNPVYIRITYDREISGEDYLVAGVRLLHKLSDNLAAGASYTRDEHDSTGYQLAGAYLDFKNETSQIELGAARMSHNDGSEGGNAVRLKASKKWSERSRTELLAAQADTGFTNNSGGVLANRRELKLSQHQKLGDNLEGKLEFSHSEALDSEERRQALELSATTQLDQWKLKGGVRQIRQTTDAEDEKINTAIIGAERSVEVLGRKGSVRAEYEREIGAEQRQRASIGADMNLTDKTKAYIRYEKADRLSSGTLAGSVETRDTLVAGVKSQVLPSTEIYSEYRIDGDISGQDVVAANGARATLNLKENLVVTPSIEFLTYLESEDKTDAVAASVGIRDTRDADAKKLLRLETRHSDDETYYGLNGTYVKRLNKSTTVMAQDELRLHQYDDERDEVMRNTLTLAAAHRPAGNGHHNALYAYKWDTDDADNKDTHILSTHQHYRINESLDISGRLGAKRQTLQQDGSRYESRAVMADARALFDINDRVSLDLHGGLLATNGSDEYRYSAGAGINVNIVENMRLGAGYNFTGFEDKDLDPDGYNAKGAYVGLQLKADESWFSWLTDDERPLVNADCEPDSRIEITDADLRKRQQKQVDKCLREQRTQYNYSAATDNYQHKKVSGHAN
jgi:uncharacterized repeat protein (TIGR01451 family)